MPHRLIISLTVVGAGLLIIALTLFSLHRALWTIWEMTPPGQILLAVNLSQPGAGLALQAAGRVLPTEVESLQSHASRFAYSRQDEGETLIIVPHPSALQVEQELAATLAAQSWQLGRRGQLIYATRRGGAPPAPALAAARIAALHLVSTRLPMQPLVLAAIGGQVLSQITEPTTAIVTARTQLEEVVVTAEIKPSLTARPAVHLSTAPAGEENLTIRVPGSILVEIPAASQQAWQHSIGEYLGLSEEQEAIIPSFTQLQELRLILHGDSVALAVQGNPDQFIQHITGLLEAQDARRRPTARTFRLPDGTLGRESVPGPLEPVFSSEADAEGCVAPLAGRTNLWLCRQHDTVVLGTQKEIALKALQPSSSRWHIQAGSNYAGLIDIPGLTSLTASGEDNAAQVVVTLRQ